MPLSSLIQLSIYREFVPCSFYLLLIEEFVGRNFAPVEAAVAGLVVAAVAVQPEPVVDLVEAAVEFVAPAAAPADLEQGSSERLHILDVVG